MDKTQTDLQLKHFLPYRLNVLSKRISTTLSKIYTEEFDITIAEWRVLLWLRNEPHLSAKAICAYTYMDKTQVSRLINQLEKRNLIQRKTDKEDSRSFQLSLTHKGAELLNTLIPNAISWEDDLIKSLTASEYRNFLVIIDKLEAQLEKLGE